jgi:hypothetical protein
VIPVRRVASAFAVLRRWERQEKGTGVHRGLGSATPPKVIGCEGRLTMPATRGGWSVSRQQDMRLNLSPTGPSTKYAAIWDGRRAFALKYQRHGS